jgi:hypothetical protein
MVHDGIRGTDAHDKKHHPLDQAHGAVATPTGALVYLVCGFDGCEQRLEVDAAVWHAELRRRAAVVATRPSHA